MARITTIKGKIKEMSEADFQALCDDYLSKEGYKNVVCLGTMAGARKTTKGTPDTYFCREDGKYIFAEYTTQSDGLVKKVESDIKKCLNEEETHIPISHIAKIIYCHTSSNLAPGDDMKLKQMCQCKGVELVLIGIDTLAEDIHSHHKTLAWDHLGIKIDTEQIQTVNDFVNQHDANELAAPLKTKFIFREEEQANLSSIFAESNVVILYGSAGVGKTRLALEFANKYANENNYELYCVRSRSISLYDDLHEYFKQNGKYLILIDDANQLSELRLVAQHLNEIHSEYKMLITVRDYAMETVVSRLNGTVNCGKVKIEKLTDKVIKELVRQNYNIQNKVYLDRIAEIAAGNARIAMMAGKVAIAEGRLESINDATALYDEYYSPIIGETEVGKDKALIASMGVAAFLERFHIDEIDSVLPVLEKAGVNREAFKESIIKLHGMEIVDIYYEKVIVFSEQSFANYILKYAFYDKRIISLADMIAVCFFSYRETTVNAVNALMDMFRVDEVHEFVRDEIKTVWNQLKNNDQAKFWEFFKSFYPIDPIESLVILKECVENAEQTGIPTEEIRQKKKRHDKDDVVSILSGFSDANEIDEALELLFMYYLKRPDNYNQIFEEFKHRFGIDENSEACEFDVQIRYLRKLFYFAQEWKNIYILLLFVDIAKYLLDFEFASSKWKIRENGVEIYMIKLRPTDSVMNYRKLIWEQLEAIAVTKEHSGLLREILNQYGGFSDSGCSGVVVEEADSICSVICAGLSYERLEDCLTVKHIATCFEKCNISTDRLRPYIENPIMTVYGVLEGPTAEDIEMQKAQHKELVKDYLNSKFPRADAFKSIFNIYSLTERKECEVLDGIEYAINQLSDDKSEYVNAIKYVLKNGGRVGINLNEVLRTLFSLLSTHEVYSLIQENACESGQLNCWMFAYFRELPSEQIDERQIEKLYDFLRDKSDEMINTSPYRDIMFLKKYYEYDSSVLEKAARLILSKKEYSPFIVKIYFERMSDSHRESIDFIRLFDNYDIIADIYFYLLKIGANHDYRGTVLYEMLQKDKTLIKRLSDELLDDKKGLLERFQHRGVVLYGLDDFVSVMDEIINEIIDRSDDIEFTIAPIMKQFLCLSRDNNDLLAKRQAWIQHYIESYYLDDKKMESLFYAISDFSEEVRKKCIEWFVGKNKDINLFKKLSLIPTSNMATGSFIPVYKRHIAYLNSLIPMFSGVDFIEHKMLIQNEVERLNHTITETGILETLNSWS